MTKPLITITCGTCKQKNHIKEKKCIKCGTSLSFNQKREAKNEQK